LTLGSSPATTLAEARQRAIEKLAAIERGDIRLDLLEDRRLRADLGSPISRL